MARYVRNSNFNATEYVEAMKKELITIGFLIANATKRIQTQVGYIDTGRSRASISVNWSESNLSHGVTDAQANFFDGVGMPERDSRNSFAVVVGSNVEYFPFLELGTRYMAPGAMLRRGFERYRQRIERLQIRRRGTND